MLSAPAQPDGGRRFVCRLAGTPVFSRSADRSFVVIFCVFQVELLAGP